MMPPSPASQRPPRWDNPFDPDMTDADVQRILAMEPFSDMEPSQFPASAPLEEIIRNDMRFQHYVDSEIIIREGDFGTSAFLIVSGDVRVILPPGLPDSILGRGQYTQKDLFQTFAQLWRNPRMPEVRDAERSSEIRQGRKVIARHKANRTLLRDMGVSWEDYPSVRPGGNLFGEIAALTRSARTSSVVAVGDVVLLEVRRQGVRDIRRWDEHFRYHVDQLYRKNSLIDHLRRTQIFQHLSGASIGAIAEKTLFEAYGDFDWHISYNRMVEQASGYRLEDEPIIAEEGHYPDGLLMVRSGFARVSRRVNNGHQTVRYIGSGALFGLEEVAHNWQAGGEDPIGLVYSLRAVGYTDILRVPTALIEKYVLPTLPTDITLERVERRAHDVPIKLERRKAPEKQTSSINEIRGAVTEALVEYRYMNGTAAMVIDLDRCIRCDACVEACAAGHNNNPRFVRHGRTFDHFMVANACMHCVDPVCMIGCPTGAIHRDRGSGQVVINDSTCIGCTTCASNCPYDNIRMVEARDGEGAYLIDDATGAPRLKATKCDLCVGQFGGPACQRACPHDALKRVDMGNVPELTAWFNRQ